MCVFHHSGGVADAQPPATGFYPYQDTDSPWDTSTTYCDDWRWETDAFSYPLRAGLFASKQKIQIQLAITHANQCCFPLGQSKSAVVLVLCGAATTRQPLRQPKSKP
jgi:hypothetical protein